MALTCAKFQSLIIDYLDGQLDAKQRLEMDRHMKACSTCANEFAMQKAWLEDKLLLLKTDLERQPSAELNAKIMAAVSLAAQQHQAETDDGSEMPGMMIKSDYAGNLDPEENEDNENDHVLPWFKRPVYRRVFSTVAALVILSVGLQVFTHLYRSSFGSSAQAPTEAAQENDEINRDLASLEYAEDLPFDSDSDEIAQDDNGIGILGNDSAVDADGDHGGADEESVTGQGSEGDSGVDETMSPGLVDEGDQQVTEEFALNELDWQVYNGFLADLPVGGSLFKPNEATKDDPVINVPTTETVAPDGDTPVNSDNTEQASPDQSDQVDPSESVLDLLAKAEAIRVLTREGPPQETLLLVFWEQNEADTAFRSLYHMSQTWPYRTALYQTPALRAQEQLEAELGSNLTDEIFTEVDLERWEIILIRIGE